MLHFLSFLFQTECRTNHIDPELNKPCVFPFRYRGKEYNECTTEAYGNIFWCGTTYHVTFSESTWGNCSSSCLVAPGNSSAQISNESASKLLLTSQVDKNHTLFLIESTYPICIPSMQWTCGEPPLGPNKPVGSYSDCEKQCNEDLNCKFIFHIPGLNCHRYASCEIMRTTVYEGSTYSKNGNCPGSVFVLCHFGFVSDLILFLFFHA